MQLSLYPEYIIEKPIRTIELFSGIGAQVQALKNIGIEFEIWRTCDWETNAIASYKAIHFPDDNTDYSKDMTKEELVEYLYHKGISTDGKKPLSHNSIKGKNEEWLRTIYNNIIATKNLVDITSTHGSDLAIDNTHTYIMTYSFPCQDLSLAGLRKGMEKGSGTRSSMLWEVKRLLQECEILPEILLMENVPQVVGKKNINAFKQWVKFLESLGYMSYGQKLNAKDYGIAQNRERYFMVSILGDYGYSFPDPIPLTKKLKDYLEKNVDEKYYISHKQLEGMQKTKFRQYNLNHTLRDEEGIANSIVARFERAPQLVNKKEELSEYLIQNDLVKEGDIIRHSYTNNRLTKWEERNISIKDNSLFPTIDTRADCLGVVVLPEATKKGYTIARGGDGVYINRPYQKRGVVQKDMIQTIKTNCNDIGVVVDETDNEGREH